MKKHSGTFTQPTPKLLGLSLQTGQWPVSDFGDDLIIGIVVTGIWPESASFRDDGMPPVPGCWGGTCETGTSFKLLKLQQETHWSSFT